MARRTSFNSVMRNVARTAARIEREQVKAARESQRELERAQRQARILETQRDKASKLAYLESRADEVEYQNKMLSENITELRAILTNSLKIDDKIYFDSLRVKEVFKNFSLPTELISPPLEPKIDTFLSNVKKPGPLEKLLPGAEGRYQKALQVAEANFNLAHKQYEANLSVYLDKVRQLQEAYDIEKQAFDLKVEEQNKSINDFEAAYRSGDPDAIIAYCTMVLERSDYPEEFPHEYRVAYVPEPKELVIEYELPNKEIIPNIAEYRYVKSKDSIEEKPRKAVEIKDLYQDVVASVCIRTIHEMFESDHCDHLQVVVFNGFVQSVDPSTGRDVRPCLISVRTTKENFSEINLSRIDKRACLRNLGAQVSPRPDEMMSVKPVVEFDMVDKRFVEQSDILTDLEDRPNLMELTPFEFENLVSNLFEHIGFQAKLTRSSKDGGVDAVAFDPRPILGGKVVIQAKRYKNVVGVSAVRDLYGTMINEGASKGILVSTSHYGPDAYEFAKDKPIELIDGGGLLYLLGQHGIVAKIIMPED